MAHTDREPRPRRTYSIPRRWRPQVCSIEKLPAGAAGPSTTFCDVLDTRSTTRTLGPLSSKRIATFLWHAARTRAARFGWEHRASASSGGLHPVELLVVGDGAATHWYDPQRHALCLVEVVDDARFAAALGRYRSLVPTRGGALLCFGVDSSRTSAKYDHAESLIWRDVGCVLATFHLCATWLNLGFCPLGALGNQVWSAVDTGNRITPAGLALLGEYEAVED